MTAQTAPSMDPGFNPGHWLHDIEDAGSKAVHGVEDAANKAKDDALGAIKDAQKAATDAITATGNAELDALHSALKELGDIKDQLDKAEHEVKNIAEQAMKDVLDKLESAAAKVAQDTLQAVCDLVDDFEAAGIEGPSFEIQLGIVSCSIEDPVSRVAALRDAITDGVHGYKEIQDIVNIILPNSVTIEFSAEIEFLVVSSNALEAGISISVSRDDLEKALELFLKRLNIL